MSILENLDIYHETLEKGLAKQPQIENHVEGIMENELNNVFLVGCGGSLGVMYPCKYILDLRSNLPAYTYNSGEFALMSPRNLTENSLVILSSYSGETEETVESAQIANEVGAATIGFTGEKDSPLGHEVDKVFANAAEEGVTDSKLIMLYQVIFNIIHHNDNFNRYKQIIEALKTLPNSLVQIKKSSKAAGKEFAKKKQSTDFFMIIGSGPCWGEAYIFATCILEEMQWIKAQPVNAGEYFHGAFEIVREDTDLIVLEGEDKTRNLIDRVMDFSKKYSDSITLVDSKDYKSPEVSSDLRGYLSPLVHSAVLDVYAKSLAEVREHPLDTRKYMGKVDY